MTDLVAELRKRHDSVAFPFVPTTPIVGPTIFSQCADEIVRLRAERDEARRLLKAVVDMMRDNMAHDATHPHHLCDFIHRPDIGMCKVCEDWTDAMVMCYPDDFQDEEDGK